MGTELAKAYVQIIPTAEGIQGKLGEMLGGEAESAGKVAGERAGGGFWATVGKAAAAATAAAGAAVVKLGTDAVKAYAEYEQLAGGVETLFKDSAGAVMQYAENAYKTAGLSANEYMETVTSFSASLLQSLNGDTAAAASVADMAIADMSDNANKMGTSMEAIQTAYQGFAKQNYTMLDNLKLGYGGTKTEMERLLADATALSGVEYDIDSLSDVYEAIHVIQTELDITGTTAKEASTTISGSLGMLKSSWSNLVAGLANPDADIGALIGNVVESAQTAFGNLLPVAENALSGIGQLVTGLAPVISEAIPMLVNDVLPGVLEAATGFLETLGGALIENAPMIFETGVSLLLELVNGLSQSLPELIPSAIEAVLTIVDTLTQPDMLSQLIDAALTLILALAEGLITALPELIAKAPEIVMNLVTAVIENAPKLLSAALELILKLGEGLKNNFSKLAEKGREIVDEVKAGIKKKIDDAKQWGKDLIKNFISGITQKWEDLKQSVSNIAQTIKDFLGFSEPEEGPLSDFHTYAPDMIDLFIQGIESKKDDLKKALTTVAKVVKEVFDDIRQSMDLRMDIAGLEYNLWEKEYDAKNTALRDAEKKLNEAKDVLGKIKEANKDNDTVGEIMIRAAQATVDARQREYDAIKDQTELDKLTKREETLNTQLTEQADIVNAAGSALAEITKQYGQGSVESLQYQRTLLQEQNAYADLAREINEVTDAKRELMATYGGAGQIAALGAAPVSNGAASVSSTSNQVTVNVSGEHMNPVEVARKVVGLITNEIRTKEAAWA